MSDSSNSSFVFFGTPEISVVALEEMAALGYVPSLVITNPDAPVGRKQILTPPPVKVWAEARGIPVLQPKNLADPKELRALTDTVWDFFTVFAYGKIIPEWILTIPRYGVINAHPSLLPKFRGASPIQSTLLTDLTAAGVSIIKMDAELDHGPILCQQAVPLTTPVPATKLRVTMGKISGCLLAHTMKELPAGTITPTPQDDGAATFCTKITKAMSELSLNPHKLPTGEEALSIYKKICAFDGWPGTYFIYNDQRIKINEAELGETGDLQLQTITPAGKNTQLFDQWLQKQT